jgi:glycosyltransferase involved in cell wall biosynthesis
VVSGKPANGIVNGINGVNGVNGADRSSAMEALRVAFVVHVMQVAGAEVLVSETIRRLGPKLSPVVFCLDSVGLLGERLRADGIDVVAFERKPGLDLSVANRMAAEIQQRGIEVVHAHQYTPFFYAALAGLRARLHSRSAPRVIFTEHGRHYPDIVPTRRRVLNRLIFDRLADRINAVCAFSADALSRNDGFRRDRIDVIENGIDLPRYQVAADRNALKHRLGLDPARRYVTIVARFHPVKDHRMLLEAFQRVASGRPDVDLLLVGDGPLRGDLTEQAAARGISDRVHFLGVRDDVPDIMAASDVFALTSVSEAASLTLLEAMASRLPVVVTAVGGNPELVRAGVDGLLVPRGDAAATAQAIGALLDDPARARAMGESGAARVAEIFRLERTIGRYYDLYAELSAESRSPN